MAGLAAVLFLYAASGPVTPWWGMVLLLAWWLVLFVLACAWWTPRPRWLPWLPVAGVAVWFPLIVAGAAWWGW